MTFEVVDRLMRISAELNGRSWQRQSLKINPSRRDEEYAELVEAFRDGDDKVSLADSDYSLDETRSFSDDPDRIFSYWTEEVVYQVLHFEMMRDDWGRFFLSELDRPHVFPNYSLGQYCKLPWFLYPQECVGCGKPLGLTVSDLLDRSSRRKIYHGKEDCPYPTDPKRCQRDWEKIKKAMQNNNEPFSTYQFFYYQHIKPQIDPTFGRKLEYTPRYLLLYPPKSPKENRWDKLLFQNLHKPLPPGVLPSYLELPESSGFTFYTDEQGRPLSKTGQIDDSLTPIVQLAQHFRKPDTVVKEAV